MPTAKHSHDLSIANEIGQRIKSGCELSFTEFYHRHSGWVYRKALRMLHNHEDAQEAANDVFSRIWSVKHQWDAGRGTFGVWVNLVCRSMLIRTYHKQQRDAAKRTGDLMSDRDDGSLPDYRDPNAKDPAEALAISETMLRVEDALLSIPSAEQRVAWTLRHVEGYTYAKIGKVIRRSEVVSQRRVKSATHFIRASIAD